MTNSRSAYLPIVFFELTYQFKRISTYIYFGIWFVVAFLSISLQEGHENSVLNSPSTLAQITAQLMMLGTIVLSAICGMSVCRDFEDDTYQLLFSTPMRRKDYLLGRLTGSLIVSLLVFSGIPAGMLLGTVMPWADRVHMTPIHLWPYLQPYILFTATTVFFAGALFFALGALTRSLVFVYLQGVLFVGLYLGMSRLMAGNLNDFWPALLDPFGLRAGGHVSRYWTLVEANTRLLPLTGALLWNRILWVGLGMVAVVAVLRFFPFSTEALAGWRRRKSRVIQNDTPANMPLEIPLVTLSFGWRATAAKFFALTRLRVRSIVTDLPFIAIGVFTVALAIVNGWGAPHVSDTPVYPVTYLMADSVGIVMLIIITTMYAGEVVWKERGLRYDQLHDTQPMPTWLNFASQLAALTAVQILILSAMMGSGIAQQAAQGYFRFELALYFKELFVLQLSVLILYSVMALFLQTILPNKFLGHAVVIGVAIGPGLLAELMDKWNVTFPSSLYDYASNPGYTYSDMNRYGPYVPSIVWYTLYWTAFAGLLVFGALIFARRGTDSGWRVRWRKASTRLRAPLVGAACACLVSFIAMGSYLYYDARVVNTEFASRKTWEARRARYEKEFKKYEFLAQPKITAVEVSVDLDPERSAALTRGVYTLVNKTAEPISSIHIFDNDRALKEASFDRTFKETLFDKELRYHIYEFNDPLKPGEMAHLTFTASKERRGLQDTQTGIVANGSFSGTGAPRIGYQRDYELDDEDARRKQGLGKHQDLPPPDTPGVRSRHLFAQDADWISFKATISTTPDQIAVMPGYLTREWLDHGRRYFTYEMGETKIQHFYTFISARFAVKRENWHGVSIEVFYDPQHPYNVDRMIQSVKAGLDYFSKEFGPYQFRQFRVLEFPRYENFAQSFANTVPFSESIGFIFHPTKEDDLDYPLYVTAHELAHQWWGHQVVGAAAQGSNIMSETLAEYSALMVVEHALGPAGVRTYLKHDLDNYLRGRRSEQRGEKTLARVTQQPYVWYQKGSLVMYALKDYIGEDRLNAALRSFLEKTKFQDTYPTVDDFISALRAAMPEDRKYLITDFFETITLFDNRAVSATWRETADKRYAVTVKVSATKLRADEKGNETEIPIDDLVDIGVFAGSGKNEKTLFLEKRRITRHEMTFDVVVDTVPTKVGIDPYNKLIDRVSDDNVVPANKG